MLSDDIRACEPIVPPSYRLHPAETTEAAQVASALLAYRVEAAADFWRGRAAPPEELRA